MARTGIAVAGAVVGGVAGYFAGGNVALGAQLGYALGSIAGAALFPPETSRIPSHIDKRIGDSSYGKPIIQVWGADFVNTNLIWTGGIEEDINEPSGKGGDGGSAQSTIKYYASFGVGVCKGPVSVVRKVRLDQHLIYDVSSTNLQLATKILNDVASNSTLSDDERADELQNIIDNLHTVQTAMHIYLGTDTQAPSPLQEAYYGAGCVPAYRDLCYIEFEDLPLASYGNRHPSVFVEVLKTHTAAVPRVEVVPAVSASLDGLIFDAPRSLLYSFNGGGYYHKVDALNNTILLSGQLGSEDWRGFGPFTQLGFANALYWWAADDGMLYSAVEFGGETFVVEKDPVNLAITFVGGVAGPNAPFILQPVFATASLITSAQYLYYASWGGIVAQNRVEVFLRPNAFLQASGGKYKELQYQATWQMGDYRPHHLAVDSQGVCWAICSSVSAFVDTSKLRAVEGIHGIIHDIDITADIERASQMAYDQISNCLLIGGLQPGTGDPWVIKFSLDTLTTVGSAGIYAVGGFSEGSWRRGIIAGSLWYVEGTQGFSRLDVATMTTQEVLDMAALGYAPAGAFFSAVYDQHADAIWTTENTVGFVKYYLNRVSYPGVLVADVIEDICEQVGYTIADDIDASLVTATLHGYSFTRQTAGADNLIPLLQAYQLDAYQSDWKMRFRPRGPRAPDAAWTIDDLGARSHGDEPVEPFAVTQVGKTNLPRRLYLNFVNPDTDYEQDTVYEMRHQGTAGIIRDEVLSTPIVFTKTNAQRLVTRLLAERWASMFEYNITTRHKNMVIDPSDIVTVDYQSRMYALRLIEVNIGANLIVEVRGVSYDPDTYIDGDRVSANPAGVVTQTITPIAATRLFLLDIPLLRDGDDNAGFYIGAGPAGPGTWRGAVAYQSSDGVQFTQLQIFTEAVVYGVTETALPDGSPYVFDRESVLRIRFAAAATLVSVTELEVLNGANGLLVGSEIIQYGTATQISATVWDVSILLRGRRGTDLSVTNHSAGEVAIVLNPTALRRVNSATGDIGASRYYKGVSFQQALASAATIPFVNTAKGLWPYAPVHLRGTRDVSDNLTITWVRRTRVAGEWRDAVEVLPGETIESYEIDILDGTTVVRTIAASTTTATYTAAEQTSDGLTPGDPVDLILYQLSAVVGRGFGREDTL